ncbi:PHP domain-containing protein [Kibdelosporangium philippinense]|uniref:PHP domain-containing protein n=1 Tax=Kibdelosporangium philippinense TaxID=211113 RepID=A0ABS8ZRZ3_9PSEU|nr:PHP domain-containing protein [Kibdelosporangium philippinense]MCE7009730.1 PHP domain-containing protein [Kibdelosporangium philippinense]
MDPAKALRLIGFYLERNGEPTYKVQAFRKAAAVVAELPAEEVQTRAKRGTLTQLPGIGKSTAGVIADAVAGREPDYLSKLIAEATLPVNGGQELRAALKGDCHVHSDWSDGGSTIREMAEVAIELGHEWMALTDHSPRLTVANGLSAERLRQQLDVVAELNEDLKPFRILTGIEVDILLDSNLDQEEELLARLDIVVASVHSELRMPSAQMTKRMIKAVSNPHTTILGHCTGRMRTAKRNRPESTFDAKAVFEACLENNVAVEVNSRPERLDPPLRLLKLAVEIGCEFAIDTDAHAPGQLDWLIQGCERAEKCGVPVERVINARSNPVG